jgi:hypothetical protein
MEEPLTCAGELEELAPALETELEPLAAQQLAKLLATIRSSDADRKRFVGVPVGVPGRRRRFVKWQTNADGLSRRQEGKGGFFGEETLGTPFRLLGLRWRWV